MIGTQWLEAFRSAKCKSVLHLPKKSMFCPLNVYKVINNFLKNSKFEFIALSIVQGTQQSHWNFSRPSRLSLSCWPKLPTCWYCINNPRTAWRRDVLTLHLSSGAKFALTWTLLLFSWRYSIFQKDVDNFEILHLHAKIGACFGVGGAVSP